ncbi:MAG TPA: hypothetical protein VJ553_02300 [Candidatus Paceibacterota bacterium]|nr:hypothetical protein [Candidatus Paceibacterota bacterium]
MSRNHPSTTTDASFQDRLDRLRLKIDSLASDQQFHLHQLANVIEEQRRRLQESKLTRQHRRS